MTLHWQFKGVIKCFSFFKSYKFNGSEVAPKDSISFRVDYYGTSIDISWSGATPISDVIKNLYRQSQLQPVRIWLL